MTAPEAIVGPGAVAVSDETSRFDEQLSYVRRQASLPVRQQVFSPDLVTSAVRIFEQRLGRQVSAGEARMLLARLVDFVRLGVNETKDAQTDRISLVPDQPGGQERSGGGKSEGR